MKSEDRDRIIARMDELDSTFAATRVYAPTLAKRVQLELGMTAAYNKLQDTSKKMCHGQYQYVGSKNIQEIKMIKPPVVPELTLVTPVSQAVRETTSSDIRVNRQAFSAVPLVDPDYIVFGAYKEIEKIIKSKIFYPVFITGHSGNGKSSQVIQACAKNNRAMIRLNITRQSDKDELIGCKTLSDGNIVIQEGPVLTAMRTGSILLMEECLSEHEKIRVGTVDNWEAVPLSEFEFDKEYPIISFNMETGCFENDVGSIISDKEDELYEVELDDNSKIVLNSKHPFIVNHEGKFVQKTIEDGLSVDDVVVKM